MPTDSIFAEPLSQPQRFAFDDNVAGVFDDMINRSVPGYQSIIAQSGLLTARFATPGSICYDLGCSLGATTFSMQAALQHSSCRIIAVDNSPAMLSRLQQKLQKITPATVPITLLDADIATLDLQPCSVAALNFTLQFVPPAARESFVARLASALQPGGALILSEKICFADPDQQRLHTQMYEQFKRDNGYSELEISQKRDALENVLIPETLEQHRKRLLGAGFQSVEVWFQCFNFLSMVAIR